MIVTLLINIDLNIFKLIKVLQANLHLNLIKNIVKNVNMGPIILIIEQVVVYSVHKEHIIYYYDKANLYNVIKFFIRIRFAN